jgi:hypothetical protein
MIAVLYLSNKFIKNRSVKKMRVKLCHGVRVRHKVYFEKGRGKLFLLFLVPVLEIPINYCKFGG